MRAGWGVWGLGLVLFLISLPLETGDDVLGWLGFALVVAGGAWMVQVNKRHFAAPSQHDPRD